MKKSENNIPIGKKRKKRKNFGYIYLFLFVFLIALFGISHFVKSYSPDVDVTIGNNDNLTLSDSDMDVEINSVDERLKWIQVEDDLPSVAIRNPDEDFSYQVKKEVKETNKKVIKSPDKNDSEYIEKSKGKENKSQKDETSANLKKSVIPLPDPVVTKVYLGKFNTLEEAMEMQKKVMADDASIAPFIKASNDYYIVQLGSFAEKQKADDFVIMLKQKGYKPKTLVVN